MNSVYRKLGQIFAPIIFTTIYQSFSSEMKNVTWLVAAGGIIFVILTMVVFICQLPVEIKKKSSFEEF